MKLEELSSRIRECRRCGLWKSRTQAVPGEGPEKARVMLIGEAPGREEDLQGRPFVGRAGRFLTQQLSQLGYSRENFFITNVVKCRPPGNRKPRSEEIKACHKWLEEQVRLVKPKLIILLGATAAEAFGLNLKERGKFIKKEGRVIFVTYHPAGAMRNKKLKGIFIQDLKKGLSKIF